MTVRSHLRILVGAIAIPLVVFAGLVVFMFGSSEDRATQRGLRDTARALTLGVDREIERSISTLKALATSDHLDRGELAAFYAAAQRVREAYPAWPTVFLIDRTGQEIFTLVRPFGTSLPNVQADPDVAHAMRTGLPRVSNLLIGPMSGLPVVRILVPVTTAGESVPYLVSATLLPARLSSILEEHRLSEGFVVILDRNGTTVARSGDGGPGIGEPGPPDVVSHARGETDGFFSSTTLGRGRHYVAFSHVPSADFTVAVAVPHDAVGHGWLPIVANASVIALAGALVLARRIADRLSRPLLRLAAQARAFGRGEHPVDDAPSHVDEVDVVRAALDDATHEHAKRVGAEMARREAEAANEAKDRMLAMLSHELRTPVTSMLGYVRILRSGKVRDDQVDRMLETVERNAYLQARLVEDLLDVSRIRAGKLELRKTRLELHACVRQAIDACRAEADASGVRIDADSTGEPLPVVGDPVRLQQVIGNLLANAIKFTPAGGRVEVTVARLDGHGRIVVRDTGVGIAPEFLPHVFEPFRQGGNGESHGRGGLGLGLAIVRSLVERHDGTIRAESAGAGLGATFTVELPLASAERADAAPSSVVPHDAGTLAV